MGERSGRSEKVGNVEECPAYGRIRRRRLVHALQIVVCGCRHPGARPDDLRIPEIALDGQLPGVVDDAAEVRAQPRPEIMHARWFIQTLLKRDRFEGGHAHALAIDRIETA